ncbi:MAG: AMP-binding protein [Verrucomicrobium sp.]|nr:AMP-binding protein [Verrucomicrobium sp.]
MNPEAFANQPSLRRHLGAAAVRGLKKNWFRTVFIDAFAGDKALKGGMLLAAAWELSAWLKKHTPAKRVGLVLPPGLGAAVANLACVLVDKTPVNLNFTAGRGLNEASIRQAEIATVLTAAAMQAKVKDFPWPQDCVDLKELLQSLPKWRILLRWVVGLLLPACLLSRAIGVPERGGDAEAGLLFTSGSSGEPKGVVLTHRNILGNAAQFEVVLEGLPIRYLLGCLPIFHSFGFTVTLWWPILGGLPVVTYVSPGETATLAEIIARHRVGLLLTTPTFLRHFLRKASAEQLAPLVMAITGAEKLPNDLAEAFEAKFCVPACQGFGMTEASPAVATNLPKPGMSRLGSVGKLFPGMAARIRDPQTGADLPQGQTGMLWLKGVNIFPGYLNDPARTADVLEDGWYKTGDLGRLDADGFLFIEGRLTRFSKLGGEMVPHGTIEEHLAAAYPERGEDFHPVVIGIDDAGKGEALIVLSPSDIDVQDLRQRLGSRGLPNLWIPRKVLVVPEIPRFATGKVDLKKCQELARQ